jgi:undecaprenyl-diphosphatase
MTSLAAATAEIAAWIAANPSVTIAVAFVVAASESVVVVGALVPGTPILMAIGAAASLGHASLWGVVAAATAGAIAGDGLSYWLGHRYRDRLLASWPIASHPILLARGVAFFRRWGAGPWQAAATAPRSASSVSR